MNRLRRWFLTGVATILPVALTILVLRFLIASTGNLLKPFFSWQPWATHLPGWVITLAGFLASLLFIIIIGALTSGLVGQKVVFWLDRLMQRLPLAKEVYGSARQLTDAVFVQRSSLRKTVIAEYPRRGALAIGFLTSDERFELADGRRALLVFFPTTPNPTSGWLALIPEDELKETGLSIEEGLKLAVSGGMVRPERFSAAVREYRSPNRPGRADS
ncbi:MAG: DUF502 domain-containing protein [candidate division WOR-3 bacterium]